MKTVGEYIKQAEGNLDYANQWNSGSPERQNFLLEAQANATLALVAATANQNNNTHRSYDPPSVS